ncbi:MAG TPA: LptE family protein [Bacteroidales bacterium]|nr:MAG: hypothetical protein BWX62_00255 [Bacteroidetes bacterium ADurb.Bin037]HPV88413.1 LptE family protein [Bacteroidales bacterium]HPW78064.1 LptE family protein [Bacteroidales bacterium]HQB55244.1 LptE family protein [Bacteroidales bacterium]
MKKISSHTGRIITLLLPLLLTQCWWYSFSGTSIHPDAQTISVSYIENRAERINPALSNILTEALMDKYTKLTRLSVTQEGGDYSVSGEITGYTIAPMAVTSDEVASMTRLTVSVRIVFQNKLEPSENFDKSFSSYEDFDSAMSFDAAESSLVDAIVEKIVEDIFNATVANW